MSRGARLLNRRSFLREVVLAGSGVLAWAACGGGGDDPVTTLDRTITLDMDGNLVYAEGEPYQVRTELAQAQAGRESRRRSLLAFHHLSDMRVLDEESPLRSEWQENCPDSGVVGAFRPQETLSAQAAEALVAAANALRRSPVTGRDVAFVIHTGNAADNSQFNELRWFLDLLDGKPVYPDSGAIGYQGVQTETPAPAYGDLLQTAQRPFKPVRLAYPWYAVMGNRDVLVQGNFAATDVQRSFATGAQKIMAMGPSALEVVCDEPSALLAADTSAKVFGDPGTVIRGVGSDPNRRLLGRREWLAEHFATEETPGPVGHGFTPEAVDAGRAYYVIDHGGVVLIVLDTVNPGGFSEGSMDRGQFQWLEEQLIARSSIYYDAQGQQVATGAGDRLIVVVSHHPPESMTNPFPGEDGAERVRGQELEALLHRFPNVVLYIAGHVLQNRITVKHAPAEPEHGYWQITTGGPLDLPLQGRLIEIVDNRDGTLSVFTTVYDAAAALNPGDAKDPSPEDGINQRELASVARQLAYRDPQADTTAGGLGPSDRNSELLITAPFDTSRLTIPTPPPGELP